MDTRFTDMARFYAGAGWPIIALTTGSKYPRPGSHGHKDATDDMETVERWWRERPSANIGLATGIDRRVVIDIDPRNRGDDVSIPAGLPPTLTALTVGNGLHLHYRVYSRVALRSRDLAPGVELKALGSYVLLPPSVVDGKEYSWISVAPIAELDASVLAEMQPPPSSTPHGEIAEAGAITLGLRNNYMKWVASVLRSGGLEEDALEDAIRGENERACDPPLTDREVGGIARWARALPS